MLAPLRAPAAGGMTGNNAGQGGGAARGGILCRHQADDKRCGGRARAQTNALLQQRRTVKIYYGMDAASAATSRRARLQERPAADGELLTPAKDAARSCGRRSPGGGKDPRTTRSTTISGVRLVLVRHDVIDDEDIRTESYTADRDLIGTSSSGGSGRRRRLGAWSDAWRFLTDITPPLPGGGAPTTRRWPTSRSPERQRRLLRISPTPSCGDGTRPTSRGSTTAPDGRSSRQGRTKYSFYSMAMDRAWNRRRHAAATPTPRDVSPRSRHVGFALPSSKRFDVAWAERTPPRHPVLDVYYSDNNGEFSLAPAGGTDSHRSRARSSTLLVLHRRHRPRRQCRGLPAEGSPGPWST